MKTVALMTTTIAASMLLAACGDRNSSPNPVPAQPVIVADLPAPMPNTCFVRHDYERDEWKKRWKNRYKRAKWRQYRWMQAQWMFAANASVTQNVFDDGGYSPAYDEYDKPGFDGEDDSNFAPGEYHPQQGPKHGGHHHGGHGGHGHNGGHHGGHGQHGPIGGGDDYHTLPYPPQHGQQPRPQYPQSFCGCQPDEIPVCDAEAGLVCVESRYYSQHNIAWWSMNNQNGFGWNGYTNPVYITRPQNNCWSQIGQTCRRGDGRRGNAVCQIVPGADYGVWVQVPPGY